MFIFSFDALHIYLKNVHLTVAIQNRMQTANIYSINDPENNQDEMLLKGKNRNDRNQMVDLNKKSLHLHAYLMRTR